MSNRVYDDDGITFLVESDALAEVEIEVAFRHRGSQYFAVAGVDVAAVSFLFDIVFGSFLSLSTPKVAPYPYHSDEGSNNDDSKSQREDQEYDASLGAA